MLNLKQSLGLTDLKKAFDNFEDQFLSVFIKEYRG